MGDLLKEVRLLISDVLAMVAKMDYHSSWLTKQQVHAIRK